MPALSTDIPYTDRPRRSSSDPIHQPPDNRNCCLLDPPPSAPTTMASTPSTIALNPDVPASSITTISIISVKIAAAMTNRTTSITPATNQNVPDALSASNTSAITAPTSCKVGSVLACPHAGGTFTSRIGLVGHLRIHCTQAGEPVPEAPKCTHPGERKHHASDAPVSPEVTVAFRQEALFEVSVEAIEGDADEDLPSDVKQ
ncbi:hypothetical protein SprV_0401504900 [Sparganum proliferum]